MDVATAQYALSTNGGSAWTGWLPVNSATPNYNATVATVSTIATFGQDSGTTHLNRIKFRMNDLAGNLGASSIYPIDVERNTADDADLDHRRSPIGGVEQRPDYRHHLDGNDGFEQRYRGVQH